MAKGSSIRYWNREKACEEFEQVYGESAISWLYETRLGQALANHVLSRPLSSQVYGAFQSSGLSRRKIRPFIQAFGIPMDEYEDQEFASFNDFFIRKFRQGARSFERDPKKMAAFSEARYFAFNQVSPDLRFPVKGQFLTALALLEDEKLAHSFVGGPMLLARLCPTDYHRFHFPDDGSVLETRRIPGRLHSVNPVALKYRGDILATNERHVSILQTDHFGRLAYVEVGALCVGRIVQTHTELSRFKRGDEKGYFLFGASTVIVLGEPGRWNPDADLLEQTRQGRETFVKIGTAIAHAC